MKIIPDKAIDLVLTDPVWPNCKIWPEIDANKLFARDAKHISRISSRAGIILGYATNPSMLHYLNMPFVRVCYLRYARPNYAGRLLGGAEFAYIFGSLPSVQPSRRILGGECVRTDNQGKVTDHPCERALAHLIWLVKTWSDTKDIIFDPFAGSFTTALAAEQLGRRWIACDISEKYCQIGEKRLAAERAQGKLFK
jgi:DNA modification methylase